MRLGLWLVGVGATLRLVVGFGLIFGVELGFDVFSVCTSHPCIRDTVSVFVAGLSVQLFGCASKLMASFDAVPTCGTVSKLTHLRVFRGIPVPDASNQSKSENMSMSQTFA